MVSWPVELIEVAMKEYNRQKDTKREKITWIKKSFGIDGQDGLLTSGSELRAVAQLLPVAAAAP